LITQQVEVRANRVDISQQNPRFQRLRGPLHLPKAFVDMSIQIHATQESFKWPQKSDIYPMNYFLRQIMDSSALCGLIVMTPQGAQIKGSKFLIYALIIRRMRRH